MEITAIERTPGGYSVLTASGDSFGADAVVLACPARNAAPSVATLSPELSAEMAAIAYSSIAVLSLAFRASELSRIPDGFGFLVPRGQGPRILGCLWSSSIFRHRAPPGSVLLHVMTGGAQDEAAVSLSDDALIETALADLKLIMNISASAQFARIFRYAHGIAQYQPGHQARLARMGVLLEGLSGLFISGSSYGGISVNHCVEEAPRVAAKVMSFLEER